MIQERQLFGVGTGRYYKQIAAANHMDPYLSIVIPCYNEEKVLPELHRRVSAVCMQTQRTYEIVLVNDGSTDKTWEIMHEISVRDPSLVAVCLSRNYGHQLALSAGLSVCRGERVLILDGDLQDPPELLPKMMEVMDGGVDVVYARRRTRPGDSAAKRAACGVFYRILRYLSDIPIPLDTGDFRLMSRRAVDLIVSMPERHRFIRGMVSWIGFRQEPFYYDRDARFAGETKYPLRKLLRLAFDGVTAFSVKPLALASYLGVITGFFGVILAIWTLLGLIKGGTPNGWISTMAAIAILGSVQLFVLGIFGEYLGRLYEQSKGRPLFVIQDVMRSQGQAPATSAPMNASTMATAETVAK